MNARIATVAAICLMLGTGCASMSRKEKGALIGAGTGAVVGGVIGKQAGNTAVGAIAGAAVGGAAGAVIGDYMDDQAAEMRRDLEGVTVERVGEGIKLTFDSGILFDVDSSALRVASKDELTELATILKKYDDTDILIEGHTDSTGTESHNQQLSESRASSVSAHLVTSAVSGARMTAVGYGERQPVASNETPTGRQQNRRVEVAIMANDDLKEAAQDQAG
jgi:outer membrane protein OmpA-like peptidoglycan-associated protein